MCSAQLNNSNNSEDRGLEWSRSVFPGLATAFYPGNICGPGSHILFYDFQEHFSKFNTITLTLHLL